MPKRNLSSATAIFTARARAWIFPRLATPFQSAAKQGHVAAQKEFDRVNRYMTQKLAEARTWRTKAEAGDARAQFELGRMHWRGDFAARNFASAAQYVEQAAKQGFAPAQHALAGYYERGERVAKNPAVSHGWLAKAADQGHGDAMFYYVRRYSDGRIEPGDFPDARRIFKKCQAIYPDHPDPAKPPKTLAGLAATASQADLPSMYLLACGYLGGDAGESEVVKGLPLLKQTADLGFGAAQLEYARRCALGDGAPLDRELAKVYAFQAAKQDFAESRWMLEGPLQVSREEVDRVLLG